MGLTVIHKLLDYCRRVWKHLQHDRYAEAQLETTCNVTTRVHSAESFPDDWASKSKSEKLQYLNDVEPTQTEEDANTTTVGFHNEIVDHFDPNQSNSATASHLAVGTNNSSFSESDTSLNNETNRFSITSSSDNGTTLKTTTFIDTSEANGNTLVECGLFTASSGGTLLNHSPISSVEKTSNKTVSITVEITVTAI